MQQIWISFQEDFKVLMQNERAQAAVMVLQPGEKTGGPDNAHANSDQWLFVVTGRGQAVVAGELVKLQPGNLLLIERGETHEIEASHDSPLETINLYVPPEY